MPLHPPGSAAITKPAGAVSCMTTLVASPPLFVMMILNSNCSGDVYDIVEGVLRPTHSHVVDQINLCCLSIVNAGGFAGGTS